MSATPEVLRHPDEQALAESIAAQLITTIVERQAATGHAHICLTGGGIGTACLAAVAASAGRDSVDWMRLDVWWGDERFVPAGDPDRNDAGARAALLDAVGIPASHVHAMPARKEANDDVEAAAAEYAAELKSAARPEDHAPVPSFDVLLLGIGPDAHVASLFPELPALTDTRSCVGVHGAPKPPPTRISLTMPSIQAAKQVWILASGAEKAGAVHLALTSGAGVMQVPAAGARGRERTLFLVDQAAAAKLPPDMGRPSV